MVLVQIHQIKTAKKIIESAAKLAKQLGKSFGVLSFVENDEQIYERTQELSLAIQFDDYHTIVRSSSRNNLIEICEKEEASFLFIQLLDDKTKTIRQSLNACRELRIPYVFYKDSFEVLDLTKVVLPIGFLEEELEKAQFAAAFGRFCCSEIQMLLANDYGSKAAINADKMKSLFEKFDFVFNIQKAKKDSFKVDIEAVLFAVNESAGLIIISASREYGLDDILFGPREFQIVKKSNVPVLMVNPRGDLYALCD